MQIDDVARLKRKKLSVLQMADWEWEAILETRERGRRFSMTFPHDEARAAQRHGLILISILDSENLISVGLVRSISAVSTFSSRVVIDLVKPLSLRSLRDLLGAVTAPQLSAARRKFPVEVAGLQSVSEKLGEALIDVIAAEKGNALALTRIVAELRKPTRYENARALQADAVSLAVKAFGGNGEAAIIALPGKDTAIATVRALEDAVITHDARWLPGWRLVDSDLTGRATFQNRDSRLEIFTANKLPLEAIFGVDLIYLNEGRRSLVMVQYKMLEPLERRSVEFEVENYKFSRLDEQEWQVRLDDKFREEIKRMKAFDKDLDSDSDYRLHSGAFYLKLVRRRSATNSAGILLSLGHFEQMLSAGQLDGPKGGLRISYKALEVVSHRVV